MGWLLLGLLLGLLVGAGALAAVLRAVGRIAGTSPRGVGRLVLDGLTPGRTRDGIAAQRALARRLKRTGERTASGRRVAAEDLTVHVSPEDHDAIAASLGIEAAEADLTAFYVDHASNNGWLVGAAPTVRLERDISLRPRQTFVRAVHRAPAEGARPPVAARPATGAVPVATSAPEPAHPLEPRADERDAEPAHPLPPDEATTDVLPRGLLGEDALHTAVYPVGAIAGDLVVVHGTDVRTVPAAQGSLRIGRGPQNDLVVDRPGIGRDHLVLEVRDGGWWAVPGTSAGGTLLDGARLEEAVPLHGTALLELGRGVRIRATVEAA